MLLSTHEAANAEIYGDIRTSRAVKNITWHNMATNEIHCVSKKVHPYDVHDNYVK